MDATPKDKKTRRKRRVPGTEKPPRINVTVRLEEQTFNRMNALLKSFKASRNEYIESLIEFDLDYRERIRPLNTPDTP